MKWNMANMVHFRWRMDLYQLNIHVHSDANNYNWVLTQTNPKKIFSLNLSLSSLNLQFCELSFKLLFADRGSYSAINLIASKQSKETI